MLKKEAPQEEKDYLVFFWCCSYTIYQELTKIIIIESINSYPVEMFSYNRMHIL